VTNNELFSVIRKIVMLVTELGDGNVVIRDPDLGSPSGEYCAIEVAGPARAYAKGGQRFTNIGPVSSPIGDVYDVNHEVRQHVLREVSLNFYRGTANDHAIKMLGAAKRVDAHSLLLTNNLGWISVGPVNDLTALQSGSHEQRAEVTITIASLETQNVQSNAIYNVPLSVQNENGIETGTETITAPPE